MKLFYDLHLHSCLSPCGDADMTPANLAAMCALAGMDVVALTDHNTTGNCAAFCRAAERNGLLALPGMELCTREEIHVVCLFPSPDRAAAFGDYVAARLPAQQNAPDIFGPQIYMDDEDGILGEESRLLAGCADIGIDDIPALIQQFGGVAYPAHIDRPSFSLLAVLGFWTSDFGFPLAELSLRCPPDFINRPDLEGLRFVTSSDAHYLEQVPDAAHWMELPERTPKAVLQWLSGPLCCVSQSTLL